MKTKMPSIAVALAFALAGCASFHATQSVRFVDDDGRFVAVTYGYGDEDHQTTFTSPVNGKEIELRSKLRVRVSMERGGSFTAYQCMNTLGSGTMYKTDNGRWMFLANGFTCMVFERDEAVDDYRVMFEGVLAQTPSADGGRRR